MSGPDAFEFIQYLTPRDMSKCEVGQCQYFTLTNQDGGIVNDAVMLRLEEQLFWLSPGDGDVLWWAMGVAVNSGMNVKVTGLDVSPLQLQGPKSPLVARDLFGDWAVELKYCRLRETTLDGIPHVTRCAHSPRLHRNIGWVNVPIEFAAVGTELVVVSPQGDLPATVCEAPWFPPQMKIPDLRNSLSLIGDFLRRGIVGKYEGSQ